MSPTAGGAHLLPAATGVDAVVYLVCLLIVISVVVLSKRNRSKRRRSASKR